MAFVPDIGDLLAHRAIGNYTLSMSHFFDLTGPSFAALRLPATLALIAFAIGPAAAWMLRRRREHFAATVTVALTSAIFLIAAHAALDRFSPMLSSQDFAERIDDLRNAEPHRPRYRHPALRRPVVRLVDPVLPQPKGRPGRWPFQFHALRQHVSGCAKHLPHLARPARRMGHTARRKILFVPLEKSDEVEPPPSARTRSCWKRPPAKLLITDRPLAAPLTASYR